MFKHLSDLGQGGFGRVDLVEDAVGQRFARKSFSFVSADTGIRENVQRRFVKEVRVQQGFSHSNIVPILGHDLSHDPPYYLMPVAQSSLDRDLTADPRLGGEWIAALTDIVEGLDELHSLSIYHRDLKPQNVLRFDGPKVKTYAISDFGLVSQKESSLSTLTVTGMKKGSDFYTAPEIASDFRKSSSRSDIYSLGCIIHDMVGEEARVPCHEIREGGPYAGVLLGCTRLKPEQRFASARAVLDAVRSIDEVASLTFSVDATIFVDALASADGLPFDFYAEVADFLESHVADRAAICLSLSLQRVQELCSYGEDVASRIAPIFAEQLRRRTPLRAVTG